MSKTAIVLGGLKSHILLIKKLKARGYYTILVDYLDAPPAAREVDEHVQISTFDVDGIRDLARARRADLIINGCLEHLNKGIAQIAEELQVPMMYSYETALNVSDKKRMKRIMRDHGVPTTDYICVRDPGEAKDLKLRYPLFVKPADRSGSTGVNRVSDPKDLERFVALAIEYSKNGEAIIEEEAVGKECNVYCVIRDGQATVLTLSEKYSEIGGQAKVTKAIGSLWPAIVSDAALANIRSAAQGIADAFGLKTTPMFMQLMVNGDEINIIEFACRMAGGYSYQNILDKHKFDYFDFTIEAFEGKCPEVHIEDNGQRSVIHSLYAYPCVYDHIDGLQELKDAGVISNFMMARDRGTQVTEESANREKIGFFIVQGDTVEQVMDKVKYVFDHIEAYDLDGKAVLRRDLILNKSMLR